MKTRSANIVAVVIVLAGMCSSVALAQQTGPVIIPRNPNDPSINEGASGRRSAGFKQNVNPLIGNLFASYIPFHGLGVAIGSLVTPGGVLAPSPANPQAYGFKPLVQRVFPYIYSQKNATNRLFPGFKQIGGKNVTDVAAPGIPGDKGPGGLYWVGYPRPGNVEVPPPAQLLHHPMDCYCRWDQQIRCPLAGPFANEYFFGPLAPVRVWQFTPCQACFAGHIVKHDYYVGLQDEGRTFTGYPVEDPGSPAYQECLRQSIDSFAASGPGGSPANGFYGL